MSSVADTGSYIPARDAALRARLHPDYIARLARQSRIKAKRVGRKWFVDERALESFLKDHSEGKKERREKLREKHKREYLEHAQPLVHVDEKIAENVSPRTQHAVVTTVKHANLWATPGINAQAVTYAIHPGVDFVHRIVALLTAFVLVFGIYGLIDREFGAAAANALVYTASGATAFVAVTLGFSPDCSSDSQRMAAAAHVAIGNLIAALDNAMPSGLDDVPLVPIDAGCSR